MSFFSFFIPRVSLDITRDFVANVFNNSVGMVDHIDFVYKMDNYGVPYNAAYVHMKSYHSTRYAQNFKKNVASSEGTKLYYNNDKDYFIVLNNTTKKHPSYTQGRKPRLVLDEDMPSKNPPPLPAKTETTQTQTQTQTAMELELNLYDKPDDIPYFYNVIAPALDGVIKYVFDNSVSIEDEYKQAKHEYQCGYW